MKIKLNIDSSIEETEVLVITPEYSTEIENLMKLLHTPKVKTIDGYKEQEIRMLRVEDIYSIFAESSKVYFQTEEEEFQSKKKLYELETLFDEHFVRINKSTLININRIQSIQFRVLGMPEILLDNDATFPISRKYMRELKIKLGIGRE